MLDMMRKSAGSWVIRAALFLIVIVFVFWGTGSFKSARSFNIATVNGETISLESYKRVYGDVLEQFKSTFKSSIITDDINNELKNFALKSLIEHKLLAQQAVKIGLSVTDRELISFIQLNPSFLSDGNFNILKYRAFLTNLGFTSDQFEDQNREFLLVKKIVDMFCGMVNVSDLEISNWYHWHDSLVALSYVFFDPDDYKNITYNDMEVRDYFDSHEQDYKINCMRKLAYVVFDPKDYLYCDNIAESDITLYYNSHPEIFENKKTVNVSHILIKTNSVPEGQAEERAKELSRVAKEGADFDKLARLYSECPSRQNGGILGDITFDSVVAPFAEKVFTMLANEISCPVKTRFGWHVIKVNSINEASMQPLSEVRDRIKTILGKTHADTVAYDRAVNFLDNCLNEDDFLNMIKMYGMNFCETDWFDEQVGPGEFGEACSSLVASIALSMQAGQISDIHEFNGCYWVMQLSDKIDAKIPAFESVKLAVVTDFEFRKRRIEAKEKANSFIEAISNGKTFEAVSKLYEVGLHHTDFFPRGELAYDTNLEGELLKEAFNMVNVGDISPNPIECEQGFYVICLKDKKRPEPISDLNNPGGDKDSISNTLLVHKQSNLIPELLREHKRNSRIVVEDRHLGA